MHVVVVGAGVIGVTSAWYLREAGCEVTVIERQPAAALETSFANGGQISVSHAEPWANPSALRHILAWFGREDAPLLWRLRADPDQWRWGLRFLRECTARRTDRNIRALIQLGLMSREALAELRSQLQLDYDQITRGILHLYTQRDAFEHAVRQSEVMKAYGCDRQPLDAADCLAIEPELAGGLPIVGGTYTPTDESGDAHRFTQLLAQSAAARGVRFRYGAIVNGLRITAGATPGVRLQGGEEIIGDHVVVAGGAYSALLLAEAGIRVPIYPAKGYSATFQLPPDIGAMQVSFTDDEARIVMSRLGNRLRVAGTAEFNGFNLTLNVRRCEAIRQRTLAWFPALAGCKADYWTGLRPSTPGNVPLIGATKLPGLWINSGHGTLGWTLACGSARLLTDLLLGRAPKIDATPYRVAP